MLPNDINKFGFIDWEASKTIILICPNVNKEFVICCHRCFKYWTKINKDVNTDQNK